jgi:hypothetical protein
VALHLADIIRRMPKKKSHPIADQFSDDEMAQIKRFGEALGGKPTALDEEVEMLLCEMEKHADKLRARAKRRG